MLIYSKNPSLSKSKKLFKSKILCALVFLGINSAFSQTVTLKIAHFLPALAPAQVDVLTPWCESIKQDSKGQFNCQFYPAMQLGGTPAQLIQQVKSGVADIVWTAPSYSAGVFPTIEAMELPFMVRDSESSFRALWEFYEKYAQDEFKDYKVLAFFTDGGMSIHTGNKAVTGLADLKGIKLRASSKYISKTAAILGANPIAMPPSQLAESISKGVIDGALGSWELLAPTKLNEITKFHTLVPEGRANIGATVLVVLMNKKKYESLSDDLKKVIDTHSGLPLSAKFAKVWDTKIDEGIKFAQAQKDTLSIITETDYAQMLKLSEPVRQEWVLQMDKRGKNGQQMLNDLINL